MRGWAAALLLVSARAPADEPTWRLRLEAGSEIDSNVHRTTGDGVAAAGGRATSRFDLGFSPRAKTLVRLDALAAVKGFAGADPAGEDIGVISGNGRFVAALDGIAPGVRASYYDAFQAHGNDANEIHDFRTGDAAATLTLAGGDNRLTASAGWRFFTYKPDRTFNFAGEHFGAAWTRRLAGGEGEPTWDLAAAYDINRRRYDGDALANLCSGTVQPSCLVDARARRVDLFHDAAVEVTWTGHRIYGARYAIQLNDSNSFGQSLVRHRLDLTATSELFADIYVNLRLVLQLNQFPDSLLLGGDLGTFTTIEDEARNAVIVHLTRDVGEAWTVEARYAVYANPIADESISYRRQTFYLGAVYTFRSAP